MTKVNFRRSTGSVALLLWVASLLVPAMELCALYPDMALQQFFQSGLWFLIAGVAGVFQGWVGWLANPLLLVLIMFLVAGEQPRLLLCGACVVFALVAFSQSGDIIHFDGGPYRGCGLAMGFWLWLAACVLPLLGVVLEARAIGGSAPTQE